MSDDKKFPSQLAERFQVRMPDGLRDRIREAAEKNGRSMNSEIVSRLEASFFLSSYVRDDNILDELKYIRSAFDQLEYMINSNVSERKSNDKYLEVYGRIAGHEETLDAMNNSQSQSQKQSDDTSE